VERSLSLAPKRFDRTRSWNLVPENLSAMETAMESSSPAVHIPSRDVDAVLFDLDGVVTQTVKPHAAAWKELFDGYLCKRAALEHKAFQPFDPDADYRHYVDGKGSKAFSSHAAWNSLMATPLIIQGGKPSVVSGTRKVTFSSNA
jgi:hypothetical protein